MCYQNKYKKYISKVQKNEKAGFISILQQEELNMNVYNVRHDYNQKLHIRLVNGQLV